MQYHTNCSLLVYGPIGLWAQELQPPGREVDLQQFIEQLFPVQDDDIPYEDVYEALFLYFTQPLDLNRASSEELKSLFILTEAQIQSFYRHLARNGKLLSLYELQAIPGWDLATINRLLSFVTVKSTSLQEDNRSLLQRITESGKGMFLQRYERVLECRAGYLPRSDILPPAYLGSPDKLYTRFRLNRAHDFSFGFTLEKDAGEPISWNPAKTSMEQIFFPGMPCFTNRADSVK